MYWGSARRYTAGVDAICRYRGNTSHGATTCNQQINVRGQNTRCRWSSAVCRSPLPPARPRHKPTESHGYTIWPDAYEATAQLWQLDGRGCSVKQIPVQFSALQYQYTTGINICRIFLVCCERSSAFLIRTFEAFLRGNAMRCTYRSDTSSSCSPTPTLSALPGVASAVLSPRPGGACWFCFFT